LLVLLAELERVQAERDTAVRIAEEARVELNHAPWRASYLAQQADVSALRARLGEARRRAKVIETVALKLDAALEPYEHGDGPLRCDAVGIANAAGELAAFLAQEET
jgi:hypothetical protein